MAIYRIALGTFKGIVLKPKPWGISSILEDEEELQGPGQCTSTHSAVSSSDLQSRYTAKRVCEMGHCEL